MMALPAFCLYSLALLLPLGLWLRHCWRQRHQRAALAAIVDSSCDAIIANDRRGVVTVWNGGAERVFGYRAQDAIGRRLTDLLDLIIPVQYQAEELAILERVGRGEVIDNYETVRQRRDGRQVPVSVTIAPILGRAGRVIGAAQTVRDLSAQRRAEAQIQRMTRTLEQQVAEPSAHIQHIDAQQRAILHHAGYAIISTDNRGVITSFNPAAERLLGYQATDLIGHATPLLFHDSNEVQQQALTLSTLSGQPLAAGFHAVLGQALQGGTSERQWHCVRQDGGQIPALLACTALRDNDGQSVGYLYMAADLSERQRAEVALRDLNAALQARTHEAEAASLAKTAFLANMSHEIRTPMNAVLGMLQLLQQAGLSPRQTSYAAKADSAARTLLALLNDILDCAQVEAGKLALDPQPFSIAQLLEDVALILASGVGTKPVDLLFDIDPALPPWLLGDALRLRQVLINLGGNAVTFTERGEVTLACRVVQRDAEQLRLEFSVRDTGIGIAADQSRRIFDGFAQAEASTAHRYGGSGLGLAISRHLVELMDGTLSLDSSTGHGSTFSFSIRCAVASAPAESNPNDPLPAGRCLLVDDNPHARQLLGAMLELRGWQVSAVDSLAAASAALQAASGFELVLADWMLDGSDGTRLGALLDSCQPRPAIIAMLSLHEQETVRQLPAGAIQVLRPLTPAGLDRAIADARNASSDAPDIGASPAPLAGLRLLLVEDNLFNQEIARELLCGAGAQIDVAADGRAGIAALQHPRQRYDAVLMDVQMPELDGYAATRLIRQMPGLQSLPIIAVSANAMASDRAAALQAGMNDHIGKPFMLEQVISAVLRHCGIDAPQPLNQAAALRRLGHDQGIYQRALRSLPAELQRLQRTLRLAISSGNVLPALHSIKGMAAMAGAEQLQALAAAAERAYRDDSPHAPAALEQVLLGCRTVAALAEQTLRQLQPPPVAAGVAWRTALPQLLQLLASANMQALPVFGTLRASLATELPGPGRALEEYIENLQFTQAHALCTQLLLTESLDAPPPPTIVESRAA